MTTLPTANENTPIRPELLKILCVLTFVGSGLPLFSNIMMFFSIDAFRELYENGSFDFLSDSNYFEVIKILINVSRSYFIIQALVYTMSVYGAYQMWKLKKIGFHLYTMAQILLIIITQIFIPDLPFPLFELLTSLIFITLYSRNLKLMT